MKTLFRNKSLPLVVLGMPLAFFILDCIIRSRSFLAWDLKQCSIYLASLGVALLFWGFIFQASLALLKLNRGLGIFFIFLIFLSEICFLILSYGFYNYFRGIPNYFVGEFIIQEPKDFYSSVSGTITLWHYTILILFTLGLSLTWLWQVKKYQNPGFSGRNIIILLLAFLTGVYGLNRYLYNYDQEILPDLNAVIITGRLFGNEILLKKKMAHSGLQESQRFQLAKSEATLPVNILIILNESLRRQSLKPFGYHLDTTPFITGFIENHPEEVFVFKKAYSNSTFTMLSFPSLVTGVSPALPGETLHKMPMVFDYGESLDYFTFLISSQTFQWRNIGKFFENKSIDYFWNKDIGNAPRVHDIGTDDRFIVREWEKALQEKNGRSFLGMLQTYANHYPYFSPRKKSNLQTRYDRSIAYVDSVVAEIFEVMEARQLLENTVVFFTSDHGEAFMEHGYSGHIRTYYEEESGIPLWVYIPRKIQNYYGKKISCLRENTAKNVSNLDILPTIIDLLNISGLPDSISANLMGSSLLEPLDNTRPIYMLNNNEVSNYRIFVSIGVLKGDYKYLFIRDAGGSREEYYNLAEDPLEKNDLIKKYPERIVEIRRELQRFPAPRIILKAEEEKKKINFYE